MIRNCGTSVITKLSGGLGRETRSPVFGSFT